MKVDIGADGFARHFSRLPIPATGPWTIHLGIYGFRRAALERFVSLEPTPLAHAEDLEQLRWLEHGGRIRVGVVDRAITAIDTEGQLAALRARLP